MKRFAATFVFICLASLSLAQKSDFVTGPDYHEFNALFDKNLTAEVALRCAWSAERRKMETQEKIQQLENSPTLLGGTRETHQTILEALRGTLKSMDLMRDRGIRLHLELSNVPQAAVSAKFLELQNQIIQTVASKQKP